jgi:hypothetical protein
MNEERSHRMVVRIHGEERAIEVVRPCNPQRTQLEGLSVSWRRTQAEADLAYEHWTRELTDEAYAIYRATQDRADAAQDHLAERASRAAA